MNIGLFPVGNTPRYYTLNTVKANLGQSINGTVREQDVVPSFRQAVEGNSSVTESPPTARATWRGFAGTFGLLKQSDAPGDLTRPYVTDLDNTRPGQLTAWLQWPGGSTVAVDKNTNATPKWPFQMVALVNDPAGWGFVAYDGISDTGYWRWNGTKFAFQRKVQGVPTQQSSSRIATGASVYLDGMFPQPIVQPTGTNLWMPIGATGCTDISVAAAAGVGVANAVHTFVYFDILFVVSVAGGNITITPYRPNTPGAGNVVQSATLAGFANALLTIPGEAICLGGVACEGAVYLCTDRSVYAIQWNDNNNTFLSTKLFELPRITGAPVAWNGEVYIPADNRIAHIVPNQRGYDWRLPDPLGVLPQPFATTVVALTPTADALIATVADTTGATFSVGHAHLRMDANGVWTCPWVVNTGTYRLPPGPPIPVVDGTNPFGIGMLTLNVNTSYFESAVVLPLPQAGKNPRTLATTQRTQRPGPFRLVSPYFDLEAEGAQKIMQRFAQMVLDASASFPIRAYYQTDFLDEAGADTFSSGCAKGTGTWHKCFYAAASSTAYAGSTDSGGRGQLWFEFDGATTYADSIGTLARYPSFKRIRFCLEVNGDTTGATVPTILTSFFDRIEFMTKAFQRQYVIVLDQGDLGGFSPAYGGSTAVALANSAAVVAEYNTLKGYDGGKTLLTEINEKGESRTVILTKFDGTPTQLNPDGTPAAYVCTLTVLDAALTGLT